MSSSVGAATFSSSIDLATGYRRWLGDMFGPYLGDSVLEIGIGDGGYFSIFGTRGSYVGLDLDQELIARARVRNPEAEYLQGDVADPAVMTRLQGMYIDTVVCFNVLEHIENDQDAVRNMTELLEPRGRLLLFVPALDALYTDLDRLAGHYRRYTTGQVTELIGDAAEIQKIQYVNPLGGVGWWLNRFVRHNDLEGSRVRWQVQFFDRIVLPLSRLLTPLTKRFFGQSVVCIARKT